MFIAFVFPFYLMAQKKSTAPSKQQMEKQMQEAMKEIDQLAKDDPEMAKAAREMMNKIQQQRKPLSVPSSPTVTYVSPIKKVSVKTPVSAPSLAQAKDQLLWYKGKKVNENTLITTNGTLIQFNRKTNQLTVQPPDSKDPFNKIDKELSKTEQRKNELIKQWSSVKNSLFFYPALMRSLKEMDATTDSYKKIIKNTFDVPGVSVTNTTSQQSASKGPNNIYNEEFSEIPTEVRETYNQVMSDIQQLPSLDFPPPPEQQFDACYTCDSTSQKEYEQKKENWIAEQFWKFEASINRKANSVIRSLIDSKGQEAQKMSQDMDDAKKIAFGRMVAKTDWLTDEYINDFPRVPLVIETNLALERQNELTGDNEDHYKERMQKIASALEGFDAYLTHQMDIKNYNVVFNLPVIIGMERQKQLLGYGDETGMHYLERVMAFNRFRLTLEVSFDMTSQDLIANGEVKSKQEFYASLGLLDCKYQMFVTNTEYGKAEENEYRVPMTITGGIKKVRENENWITYSYSGPKDMYSVFPAFRISFCGTGPDSVYLEILRYDAEAMNNVNAKSIEHGYGIDFLGYSSMLFFQDPSALEAAVPMEKNLGEQMLKLMGSQVTQPTGNAELDKLQDGYEKMKKMQDLQYQMSGLALQNKLLVLFDAHNNSSELINVTTEPGHKMDKMSISGKVHIQVLHDPLPYDSHSIRKPLRK